MHHLMHDEQSGQTTPFVISAASKAARPNCIALCAVLDTGRQLPFSGNTDSRAVARA